MIMNMKPEKLVMPLPEVARGGWHLAIDTAAASPRDIIVPAKQSRQNALSCTVKPRSVVVFERR